MPLHQSSGQWRVGLALSLVAVFLWGILPIALEVVLQHIDVYTITWFRFTLSAVVLGVFLAIRGQFPNRQTLKQVNWALLAIATLFLAANYLFFLEGLHRTSPTNAEVVIQLAPVLTGLGAIAVFGERYSLKQWSGLGVLTLGMVLFFHDQLQILVGASQAYLIGSGIVVVAAIVWAVYALAQKQLLLNLSSASVMLLIYTGSALLFAPLAKPSTLLSLNTLEWGMLIFAGLNTVLAYGAFAASLEHWDASRVSAVITITPLVTLGAVVVTSALFPTLADLGQVNLLGVVGAVLVILGAAIAALAKTTSKPNLQRIRHTS